MNWITKSEERLETLPKFEKFEDDSRYDSYWGKGMPWARMNRWFESQEGIHVDSVFHKFVNLKWLLPEYRTKEQFHRHIEVNTFWSDGKICCYNAYWDRWNGKPYRVIEESAFKIIYVHPNSRLICVFHPTSQKSYRKKEQEKRDAKVRILGDYHQLYKQDGIWYEVKAEIVKVWDIPPYLQSSNYFKPYMKKGRWVGYPQKEKTDILLENDGSSWKFKDSHPIRIVMKRQLSSKELKHFGLTNNIR